MERVFLAIFNMSVTATYTLVIVLALRLLLKRLPKWLSYSLWAIVLYRLVSPLSYPSSFSILGTMVKTATNAGRIEYIPADIGKMAIPRVDLGLPAVNGLINDALPWGATSAGANLLQTAIRFGAAVWFAGFFGLLLYSMVSYWRLRRQISPATQISGNVFETDSIDSPFVCGFFKPGIYLPSGLDEASRGAVLRHEQTHIRRLDHLIKPVAFLVLAIHWFNPLIWLAFRLMSRDMEMSCDERVVRDMRRDEKADYGEALVRLAMKRPILAGSPLAFGEGGIKGRVQNLLKARKPAFWVLAIVILALLLVGTALLANPLAIGPNGQASIWQKDFFGSRVFASLDHPSTEEDRALVAPVLATAFKVFTYVGKKADADPNVGALSQYYHDSDASPLKTYTCDLQLITARVVNNRGFLWVVYTDTQYDQDGKLVGGSSDILSYWEIEKKEDRWQVIDITEHP